MEPAKQVERCSISNVNEIDALKCLKESIPSDGRMGSQFGLIHLDQAEFRPVRIAAPMLYADEDAPPAPTSSTGRMADWLDLVGSRLSTLDSRSGHARRTRQTRKGLIRFD